MQRVLANLVVNAFPVLPDSSPTELEHFHVGRPIGGPQRKVYERGKRVSDLLLYGRLVHDAQLEVVTI